MKVLLIDGAPVFGGQSRHVYDLTVRLRDRGHEVTVSCNHKKLYKALDAAGVPLIRAKFRHGPDLPTILALSRAIKRARFDVVHTHGVRAGVTGRIAARLAGCQKIIHTVHSMSLDFARSPGLAGRAARFAYRCADRWLSCWTDTIITASADLRRLTVEEGVREDKVVVVHSGVDLSKYENPADRTYARNRLCIPTGCKVVGTACRFTKQKNLGDLIRAANIVCRRFDDAIFVLAGDGEEMQSLRRLAQDLGTAHRIIFPGHRDDIPEILPAFDVFALSSLWEGHPLSVLEAMAAGLPVVAPDITGIGETVVDGVTGHIVPPSDPASLAAAIIRVFEEGRAESMGMAGRERALRLFGLDRMVEQIERIYLGQAEQRTMGITAAAVR